MKRPHIELAHNTWKKVLREGDLAIDATCGNGHDTLFLAQLPTSKVYAFDVQEEAVKATQEKTPLDKVIIKKCCHSEFPEEIKQRSVRLITYNLGYLPGGDKSVTTMTETTLLSLSRALKLVAEGGMISITCYPGHPEGKIEEEAVLTFASKLDSSIWSVCHHRWINRLAAPSLLFLSLGFTTPYR